MRIHEALVLYLAVILLALADARLHPVRDVARVGATTSPTCTL